MENIFAQQPRTNTYRTLPLPPSSSHHQAKSVSKVIKADIYPEFGTYPGGGGVPPSSFGSGKNAEREVIHGRWAMLGVTGAWAAESGTGIPCRRYPLHPRRLHRRRGQIPRRRRSPRPRGLRLPLLLGRPRHRGRPRRPRRSLPHRPLRPVFDELTVSDVSPGGRFDLSASPSPVTSRAQDQGAQALPPLHVRVARLHLPGSRHPGGAPSPAGRRTSRTPSTPTCSPTPPPASASTKSCAPALGFGCRM